MVVDHHAVLRRLEHGSAVRAEIAIVLSHGFQTFWSVVASIEPVVHLRVVNQSGHHLTEVAGRQGTLASRRGVGYSRRTKALVEILD